MSVQWFGSEALELTYKDAGRQGRQRAALPPRRAAPRGRRAGPAVELRRRRRAVPPGLRGAPHPPGAPVRPGAGGAHLASSSRCRTRSRPSTRRCCRASRCASCWPTTRAPARPSWPGCSSRS
ncbi:MAG: hypothetical protein MZV49_05505 [Rhodopseudomonas palustris]|nr:hypothetical protein [Rhodopseudomonas palustris]